MVIIYQIVYTFVSESVVYSLFHAFNGVPFWTVILSISLSLSLTFKWIGGLISSNHRIFPLSGIQNATCIRNNCALRVLCRTLTHRVTFKNTHTHIHTKGNEIYRCANRAIDDSNAGFQIARTNNKGGHYCVVIILLVVVSDGKRIDLKRVI